MEPVEPGPQGTFEDRAHGCSRVSRRAGGADGGPGRRAAQASAGRRGAGQRGQQDGDDHHRDGGERARGGGQSDGDEAGRHLRKAAQQRPFGSDAALAPKTQPVEGPGGRPPHERAEDDPVEETSRASPTRLVVVAGEEPDAVRGRDVAPVAAPFADERERMPGGEAESGGARPVGAVPLSRAGARARDEQPGKHPDRVPETLRLALGAGQVVDVREAQVPAPVQRGFLCPVPEPVQVGAYQRLDVKPHVPVLRRNLSGCSKTTVRHS